MSATGVRILHRALAIAVLGALLVLSAGGTALVSQVLELLPDGFPYLGGTCGLGVRVNQLDLALGVNCGNARTRGDTTSCGSVPGGHFCNVTFEGYGQVFRWINAGRLVSELFGSCSDVKTSSWTGLDAMLPLNLHLSCSVGVFIPQGGCSSLEIYARAAFEGAYAPPVWTYGPDVTRLCP